MFGIIIAMEETRETGLRRHKKLLFLVSYGVPFIIALVFGFAHSDGTNNVPTLWDYVRLAFIWLLVSFQVLSENGDAETGNFYRGYMLAVTLGTVISVTFFQGFANGLTAALAVALVTHLARPIRRFLVDLRSKGLL